MEQGPGNKEQGFRRLTAWQRADDLACETFRIASLIPPDHRWLRSQVSRAAVSVPANIAEGYSRGGLKEYARFLDIARGSLGELEYYIHFLRRNHIIDDESMGALDSLRAETARLLFGLIQSLRQKIGEGGEWQRGRVGEDSLSYLVSGGE